MMLASSQRHSIRGTGTSVLRSACMMRYSRSTACAEGNRVPGGLRRKTYLIPAYGQLISGIGLPAFELLNFERAFDFRHVFAKVLRQSSDIEYMCGSNRTRTDIKL